jgi:endonuclease YncB( thermonuclease family)
VLRGGLVAVAVGLLAACVGGVGAGVSPEPTAAGSSADRGGAQGSAVPARTPGQPERDAQVGVVSRVIDGDTLDVAGIGRIRVIGIDTPERGRCGYDSATLALADLVLGEEVTLVPGATDDTDRYGRLLRYVDVGDVDAGLRLVEEGWALARYDSRDGSGRHRREEQYVAADLASADLGCYEVDEP